MNGIEINSYVDPETGRRFEIVATCELSGEQRAEVIRSGKYRECRPVGAKFFHLDRHDQLRVGTELAMLVIATEDFSSTSSSAV